MKFKIAIFLILVLICNSFAFSTNSSKFHIKSISKAQAESGSEENKSTKVSHIIGEVLTPPCRVCCTISVIDAYGNVRMATACAGWLLTSCETAAERACEKAWDALEWLEL